MKPSIYIFILAMLTCSNSIGQKKHVTQDYIQEKEGIYHYAILNELPFENECPDGISEEQRIACSEKHLRALVYEQLNEVKDFVGNAYVYVTVNENGEMVDISAITYPKSEKTIHKIENAVKRLKLSAPKYHGKSVKTRLWTPFTFPSSSKELFSESLEKMVSDPAPEYSDYETLVFEASQYIFGNPVYPNGKEFNAASKVVGFWMNKDTGMGIPTFGEFYSALSNKDKQQFLYTVAMINYGLGQKLNNGRILSCLPKEGEIYNQQEDVREVQLEGAKILLDFIGIEKNNVPMNSKTKKFYKAYLKGQLEEKMFGQ